MRRQKRRREGRREPKVLSADGGCCVHSTQTLGWNGEATATDYMNFMVSRCNLILRRHSWRVVCLEEFYPKSQRLLGLNKNGGECIMVRFRSADNRDHFLPMEEVLCTALHEVCHITISYHRKPFWELYKSLVEECESNEVGLVRQITSHAALPSQPQWQWGGNEERDRISSAAFVPFAGQGHALGGKPCGANTPEDVRSRVAAAVLSRLQSASVVVMQFVDPEQEGEGDDDTATNSDDMEVADSGAAAVATVTATMRSEDDWVCARCGFRNCGLLDVCEFCGVRDGGCAPQLREHLGLRRTGEGEGDVGTKNCPIQL